MATVSTKDTVSGGGGLLAVNNLSDVASKPTSFNTIKQAATEGASGVLPIATDVEFVAQTETTKALVPSNMKVAHPVVGTTGDFSDAVEIANEKWFKGTDFSGAGIVNIAKVNEDDEIDVGATLVTGSVEAVEDSGMITRTDMPISASATGEQSFTDKIDGDNVLTYGATPDGAGGARGQFVKNNGAVKSHRTTVGAEDYNPSILTADYIIGMTDTAAERDCIISTEDVESGTADNPRHFVVVDESGAAGTNNIVISLENGGTISGAATAVIAANSDSISFYCTGTNAFIH